VARAGTQVQLTQANRVRGKLGYLAPEQARGQSFDGRADLFALGVTLHEALTGQPLFKEDITERLQPTPPASLLPPSAFRRDVPPELDAAIMDLLQWRSEERTPRGQRLREQLCGLTGADAPYPHGQQALARLVQEALVRKGEQVGPRNQETDTLDPTHPSSEEEPTTAVLDVGDPSLR
jgi:serine/threonine-protein kinase